MKGDVRRIEMGDLVEALTFCPPSLDACKQSEEQAFLWYTRWDRQLSVLRRVAQLLGQGDKGLPVSLVTDGDILAIILLHASSKGL